MSIGADPNDTSKLTIDELIRLELRGKFSAIERYDSMLWKIRSGYILVLYGTLTIVGGTSGLLATPPRDDHQMFVAALLLLWGFSLSGLIVDLFFLRAKFRVINDANRLQDLALDIAMGKSVNHEQYDTLRDLLHISGESTKKVRGPQFHYAWRSVLWIYMTTPLLGIAILSIVWSR